MHIKKSKPAGLRLVALGLVLAIVPFLLNDFIKLPDAVRGLLTGIGMGLELTGIIVMIKQKKQRLQ